MPSLTFDDILKYNPYHDRLGRFASASSVGAVSAPMAGGSAAGKPAENPKVGAGSSLPAEALKKMQRN